MSRLTFKLGTSQIQVRNVTTLGNLLIFTMRIANRLKHELQQGFLSSACQSCRPIFRKFKILTLVSLYIFEMLCFLKIYKWNLKHNSEIHGHKTRRKQDLHTQQCNTLTYPKSVINMGIKLFNKLLMQIKQLDKYKSFKKEVKTFPSFIMHFIQLRNFLQFE